MVDAASASKRIQIRGNGKTGAKAFPLALLTAVTLLAFYNAWPDMLVFDDKFFVGPARPPVLDSLYNIFTTGVWAPWGTNDGLYRPLLLLNLWLESRVFGNWLPGYHLSNIFLHLCVTFLAYGFFGHLLRLTSNKSATSDLYALLAALVFAVHPVHTEVVNSVFNRSESMVAMFGLAGIWWLLHYLETHSHKAWFGLGVGYFMALLSKESAVVIPVLAVLPIVLLTNGSLIDRARRAFPVLWLILPLGLYLAMRAYALPDPFMNSIAPVTTFGEKIVYFSEFLGESLKVMVWPYPLQLYHPEPLAFMSAGYVALHLILIIIFILQLKWKRYGLAAGLAFCYISTLPATRFFGILGGTPELAERYLYVPSIGLAIMLAFALRSLAQRYGPHVLVGIGIPILVVLIAVTWDRNMEWASEATLFETEYQRGDRTLSTLRLLTAAQLTAKNQARVVEICDENQEKQEKYALSKFVHYCAIAYEHQHRYEEAERAHLLRTDHPKVKVNASIDLARFYIRLERFRDAEKYFNTAIERSNDAAQKALYEAEMILSLNPKSRKQGIVARTYIIEALRIRPGWTQAESMLKSLDHALNRPATRETVTEESGN